MKKPNKDDLFFIGQITLIVLTLLVAISCLVIKIWVIYEFGDMPITEVPSWALLWLGK